MTGSDLEAAPGWLREALAQPTESHTIGAAGEELHFRTWAAPAVDRGGAEAPGLLLVHGFGAHSHWWDACAPYLAKDFRVVAMDLAGMGDSAHRPSYTQRQYADDIAAVITAAGLAPAIVVGHRFGGIMTTWAAHFHPSLVRIAIIVDSRLNFAEDEAAEDAREQRPRRTYPDYATARARFRLIPEENCTEPALFEHVARHSLRRADGGWQWKFDDRIIHSLPWPEQPEAELLASLVPPVALVCGELSKVAPPEFAWRMADRLKVVRPPLLIPEAHHHVLLDQPLALVASLRSVLSEFITPRDF